MARSRPAKGQGNGKDKSSTPARRTRQGGDSGSRRPQTRQRQAQPPKKGSVTKAVQEQRKGSRFLVDMVNELRKVQWPTRPQLLQGVAVVTVVVMIVVAYLWAIDSVLARVIDSVF